MNNKFTIYENPVYFGAYVVVDNETGKRIDCHNLATAISHIRDQYNVQQPKKEIVHQLTLEEYYGCLTGGMGYTPAITWTLTGRVERVHNWATAKEIARTYPKKKWS